MATYKQLEKKVERIEDKMGDIRRFEQHFNSIASKIKSVEIAPLKFRSDDLSLDLKETRKSIKQLRSSSTMDINKWNKTMGRLNDILSTAEKFASYTYTNLSVNQQRARLLEDILVQTRDSARFQGMMESAYKSSSSRLQSEEELFYLVVKESMDVPGIDKRGFITRLNAKLRNSGYPEIDRNLLKMI